jgi:hypothetical protein
LVSLVFVVSSAFLSCSSQPRRRRDDAVSAFLSKQ